MPSHTLVLPFQTSGLYLRMNSFSSWLWIVTSSETFRSTQSKPDPTSPQGGRLLRSTAEDGAVLTEALTQGLGALVGVALQPVLLSVDEVVAAPAIGHPGTAVCRAF